MNSLRIAQELSDEHFATVCHRVWEHSVRRIRCIENMLRVRRKHHSTGHGSSSYLLNNLVCSPASPSLFALVQWTEIQTQDDNSSHESLQERGRGRTSGNGAKSLVPG